MYSGFYMMNEDEIKQLAHDLRNELSSMYSYAQLLELSLDTPDSQKESILAKGISTSVRNMIALVAERMEK